MAELRVDFAGVSVAFAGDAEVLRQAVPPCSGAFLTDREPGWRVELELAAADGPWAGPRVEVVGRPDGFELRGATFLARADMARRQARVAGPALPYPLGTLLKHLLPAILEDAVVFHAALLVDGERGFLGCGPSGSGKTTLAGLLPERALCDELVAVRQVEHGFRAEALPLWQARPGSALLEGVFLLRHGPWARRRRLDAALALRGLAGGVLWPTARLAAMPVTLARLGAVAETVPVFDLEFAPDAEVWRTIAMPAAEAGRD